MSQELQNALQTYIRETVEKQLKESLQKINVSDEVAKYVKQSIEGTITKMEFPPNSINHGAINWTDFRVNANMITGNYDSINTKELSSPQLDVTDEQVIVTNQLSSPDILTTNINVKNVDVKTLNAESIKVKELQAEEINGLNDKIKDVLGGDRLPKSMLHSNLRTVGQLEDLVVSGESLLGDTLYSSSSGRVGINTDEPESTLTIWEEETNLKIGKHAKDTMDIRSKNKLILGSGTKNNIELTQDGEVWIDNLMLNGKKFTYVNDTPGYEGEKGDIAWNMNPDVGKPVGWVCIENTRWAKFGIAE